MSTLGYTPAAAIPGPSGRFGPRAVDLTVECEWLGRVERCGAIPVPRTAGTGASRPLPRTPAKVP